MRMALAQINPVIGDFSGNSDRMTARIAEARTAGCDLIVFSELAVPGYPPRDLLERQDFVAAAEAAQADLIRQDHGIAVIFGGITRNPAAVGKPLFNSAIFSAGGRERGRIHKRLLPTYDVFDESRYFESGSSSPILTFGRHRLGITICEDAWNDPALLPGWVYPADPVAEQAAAGADVLINIAASPFHVGKRALRRRLYGGLALKYRLPVIYVNQVGGNDSVLFEGISTAFGPDGTVAAQCGDFVEDWTVVDFPTGANVADAIHPVADSDTAAVYKALVMGVRDYVSKCGFSRAVIGLSGGIDSALTAAVAVDALGADAVATLFMPSDYTSADNHHDTRQLAESLGVAYETIPIGGIYRQFLETVGSDPRSPRPGVTEQNLQARIRGTLLMARSNRTGAMVLSTGNKSEMAVGYCTLYGDMNGGLSVISDVPKTMVYALARHVNRVREVIPRRVIEKAPSAELAPDQKDSDDLPPYDLLDRILTGYIEQGRSIRELVADGLDEPTVRQVIRRVALNEYKRRQAAPGLKVTTKAFGEGRRYPLAKQFWDE